MDWFDLNIIPWTNNNNQENTLIKKIDASRHQKKNIFRYEKDRLVPEFIMLVR